MGGISLFRKFLVLSIFSLFSANLFAQTAYTLNLSVGADAAEPDTNGFFVAAVTPAVAAGTDIYACLNVQGGTATENTDYEEISNANESCSVGEVRVNFSSNGSSLQIPLNVLDDSEFEGNETVTLGISGAIDLFCSGCGSTVSAGTSATANIADDDTPPVNYTINLAAGADAAEPSTDGYFTATVSPIPPVSFDGTVVACIGVTGGTATEAEDFQAIERTLEGGCPSGSYEVWFENGEWSFDIPINVLDDPDYEGNETVTVGVTQASVWSTNDTASAGTPATLNIEDDDDTATYTVYKYFSDGNPMPVDVMVSCTDATIDQSSQQASYSTPAVFNLSSVGPSNTCTATEAPISGYTNESLFCTNEPVAPTSAPYCYLDSIYDGVSVEIRSKRSASEPKKDSAFELILSGSPPWGGMDVNLSVGGTATPDADYEEIADRINVPYGSMVLDVPVKVLDDEDEEPVETIVLTVLEGDIDFQNCGEYAQTASGRGKSGKQDNGCDAYYTPGEQSEASMNLFDDDKPRVSIERKGDAAEPNTVGAFMLNLGEPAPAGGLNINLQIAGSALAGEDYESLDSPVFVPAGSTEFELRVVPIDDDEVEQSETVQVTVMPGEGYIFATGSAGQAVVNIADDDTDTPPVSSGITVSPTSGLVTDEDGATAQFTVVLQSPPTDPVSIAMESSDTTEGTINPMALEFNTFNWNIAQTVTVTGQSDTEEDGDQAYTVMLNPAVSNDSNYAGIDPADVSVLNTDTTLPPEPDPSSAQFTQSIYTVEEADGIAQVALKRLGNPEVALTVQVSTADNADGTTATAGEDYTPLSNVDVSWAAGDTDDKVVEITVFENVDTVTGENETVELVLTVPDMDDQTASLEIVSDVADDIVGGISDDELPPNQQDIVSVILDTCPKGGNEEDFQGLCTALVFSAADGNSVSDAIKQATPDDAAAVRSSGMQTTGVQVTAVDGRLGTLRGGGGAGFSASGFSMNYGEFAMSGSLMKSFITAFDQNNPDFMQNNANQDDTNILDDFGRWGAWITGRVVFGEKDPTTNQVEYDFDTAGVTFGLDYRFTNEFVAGVAVGYANTDAKLGQNDGELDSKGYSVSLYGTWFKSDRFYMGGSLGYGSNDYDHQRNVRYTIDRPEAGSDFLPDFVFDVDQTLGAEYDGSQFSASLSGGWDFNRKGWTFGPTLSVSYVNVDVDDYDEFLLSSNMPQAFASSGWAVHIDDQNYESLQPAIGFAFTKAVSASWGVFIPQGYVDVISEMKDSGTLITGQFIGDNNNARFALETDDFEETFVRAGLGFGLILKNNKSAFLMVDGDFGRDLLSTYYINAGFRWQF